MATGGSGDVLTGIITEVAGAGLCSKNRPLLPAGVFLHGLAGDAATALSQEAMIASNLNYLGKSLSAGDDSLMGYAFSRIMFLYTIIIHYSWL